MTKRSYFLHQAEVCGSLARGTEDPKLRQRYEDLAIEFLQRGSRESDLEFVSAAEPNLDRGHARTR